MCTLNRHASGLRARTAATCPSSLAPNPSTCGPPCHASYSSIAPAAQATGRASRSTGLNTRHVPPPRRDCGGNQTQPPGAKSWVGNAAPKTQLAEGWGMINECLKHIRHVGGSPLLLAHGEKHESEPERPPTSHSKNSRPSPADAAKRQPALSQNSCRRRHLYTPRHAFAQQDNPLCACLRPHQDFRRTRRSAGLSGRRYLDSRRSGERMPATLAHPASRDKGRDHGGERARRHTARITARGVALTPP